MNTHSLDPKDATVTNALRAMVSSTKGVSQGIAGREPYDALLESVPAPEAVTFESATVGEIPGVWVQPANARPDESILHLHGGWFSMGSAQAYRHLVGQIAVRAGAKAFIPDYRLAPEHPFPAATDDALAAYRGIMSSGVRRIAITGDSAGGTLALGLASRVIDQATEAKLVAIAVFSPVTDLTLSGDSYKTRAEADPFFTRPQAADFVHAYLGNADPKDPLASPLFGQLAGLPPIRIDVGDDEVLLDDSRRYAERAAAAGVEVNLNVWMGMPHGWPANIGRLKAAAEALDDFGAFLSKRLRAKS